MKHERNYQDKTWLYDEYINNNRTLTDIGNQMRVSPMTIHNWLDKHGIPTRPRGVHSGGPASPRFRVKTVTISENEYNRLIEIEHKWRVSNE